MLGHFQSSGFFTNPQCTGLKRSETVVKKRPAQVRHGDNLRALRRVRKPKSRGTRYGIGRPS